MSPIFSYELCVWRLGFRYFAAVGMPDDGLKSQNHANSQVSHHKYFAKPHVKPNHDAFCVARSELVLQLETPQISYMTPHSRQIVLLHRIPRARRGRSGTGRRTPLRRRGSSEKQCLRLLCSVLSAAPSSALTVVKPTKTDNGESFAPEKSFVEESMNSFPTRLSTWFSVDFGTSCRRTRAWEQCTHGLKV